LANVTFLKEISPTKSKLAYRPVSLLPSLSKICGKHCFYTPLYFLLESGFLYKCQSGFRPGDSTVYQLIYIIHQIYSAFDAGKEVRVVFLDISKAFDRVWHAGLIKKNSRHWAL
jgi:hypothetical protein